MFMFLLRTCVFFILTIGNYKKTYQFLKLHCFNLRYNKSSPLLHYYVKDIFDQSYLLFLHENVNGGQVIASVFALDLFLEVVHPRVYVIAGLVDQDFSVDREKWG